ncbi:DUF5372 family protein [Rhodoblastus sphagnicola]|uniref:DUF5372 family protein n=1 Tax=Rhodoblastus sphagnicola TaxID=333368 RepID=UPI003CC86472
MCAVGATAREYRSGRCARRPPLWPWIKSSTAARVGTTELTVSIAALPSVPGQTFDVVSRSPHWGEEPVIRRAAGGALATIAVSMSACSPSS